MSKLSDWLSKHNSTKLFKEPFKDLNEDFLFFLKNKETQTSKFNLLESWNKILLNLKNYQKKNLEKNKLLIPKLVKLNKINKNDNKKLFFNLTSYKNIINFIIVILTFCIILLVKNTYKQIKKKKDDVNIENKNKENKDKENELGSRYDELIDYYFKDDINNQLI